MLKGTKHLLCVGTPRKFENETLIYKKRKNSVKNKIYRLRVDLLTSSAVPLLFTIHERNVFFNALPLIFLLHGFIVTSERSRERATKM